MTPNSLLTSPFETALNQLGRIVSDLEQGEPELAAAWPSTSRRSAFWPIATA